MNTERLMVFPFSDGKYYLKKGYELLRDYTLIYKNQNINVPQSFRFDGATIPRLCWRVIGTPYDPRFMQAALIHDWLYMSHQMKRRDADKIFYSLLLCSGVNKTRAMLMKWAVRVFGAFYWPNNKRDRKYLDVVKASILDRDLDPQNYGLSEKTL